MTNNQQNINSSFTYGATLHFVGIGGIGMSGLAQMLSSQGFNVTGSDRGCDKPENSSIFNSLIAQGIEIFPQDGSFIKKVNPDALIFSTAIEADNPDFIAAGSRMEKIHRSEALALSMELNNSQKMIAITGSCGKTTVSAWLAETLFLIGNSPSYLSGGLVKRFITPEYTGNFHAGNGSFMVFEADESDKSLLAYAPDYAVILNIGTDHYSKDELIRVFREFISKVKIGVVVSTEVYSMLGKDCFRGLEVVTFSELSSDIKGDWRVSGYNVNDNVITAQINEKEEIDLPAPGVHTAANAAAILATMDLIDRSIEESILKLKEFKGVWRRFDYHGKLSTGASVYDDYAHNVEKICASIKAAKEITKGKLIIIFQPHGFGPLKFMQEPLYDALINTLSENDIFALLPVFYEGGTTSFKPTSKEVINNYNKNSNKNSNKNFIYLKTRKEAELYIESNSFDIDTVVTMGARDNSLSDWAKKITCQNAI